MDKKLVIGSIRTEKMQNFVKKLIGVQQVIIAL